MIRTYFVMGHYTVVVMMMMVSNSGFLCFLVVEKSRAPRPYYVDHHEAVSHQDVTTDYLAQDTKGSVIITVSWNPGLPCK